MFLNLDIGFYQSIMVSCHGFYPSVMVSCHEFRVVPSTRVTLGFSPPHPTPPGARSSLQETAEAKQAAKEAKSLRVIEEEAKRKAKEAKEAGETHPENPPRKSTDGKT